MPRSMTGFGRGECLRYDRRFKVELKSVNHRFSDFTIKLPRFLNPFEDRIRRRLSQDIARGKVDVWVNFESYTHKDITVQVNKVFADAYMEALQSLSTRYRLGDLQLNPSLELLAKNSDIIVFDKFESALNSATSQQEMWETLSYALDEAMAQFNKMRNAEGLALIKDIENKLSRASAFVMAIKERAPHVVQEQSTRLHERMEEVLGKVGAKPDEGRLLTEIALLADKGCINEEISRLESHLAQLESMLAEQEAVGRKMDFLVQELNRETNTIGSKSTDVKMTKLIVELKSLIEKIREQVQNIE